jgi:tetraacyldisaccharide-1-P 4'-kinase
VRPEDELDTVGDDALFAARSLSSDARVVVGPTRQAGVDFASHLGASVIVADGLLQTKPVRLTQAILVLDAGAPWGAGACPPAGDLRAQPERLLAAADRVALVATASEEPSNPFPVSYVVRNTVTGARDPSGGFATVEMLRGVRVGLILAVARPSRIVRALAAEAIFPVATRLFGDHARIDPTTFARLPPVDAWLTTGRCMTKLGAPIRGAPVLALEHALAVGPLTDAIASCLNRAPRLW